MRSQKVGYAFVAPYLLYFAMFMAYPLIFSFILIFHKWNIILPMQFVGLSNFHKMMQDSLYWKSLWNTVRFLIIHIPLQIAVALVLAEVLNQKIRMVGFFRGAFFLPVVISGVVVTILWKQLFSTDTGLLNLLLGELGLNRVPWLTHPDWAMPSIALMATWKNVGFYVILFLAGLQSIPAQLYEAATLDGATKVQQFFHVTIPAINSTMLLVVILSTMNGFALFVEPYVLTGGGPLNSTLSVVLYMYKQAFSFGKMGYAATLGFSLALIIFIVVIIQKKFVEREV